MSEYRGVTAEEFAPLAAIAEKYGVAEKENLFRFVDTRLNKEYDVWLMRGIRGRLILKKDKKRRGDKTVYDTYFAGRDFAVPEIYDSITIGEDLYVVMEYADADDARDCSADQTSIIGKQLARIQSAHLRQGGHTEEADRYFKYVEDCCSKIHGWFDDFDEVYEIVRERFFDAPHTLIHDDLLPINVLWLKEKIWFIDWETSGILPYFLDLARFAFVTDGERHFYIPHDAGMAFLDAYYREMWENNDFYEDKEQFLRDVAISAFCQYASFLSYDDEATARETTDFRYMQEIIRYLRAPKS